MIKLNSAIKTEWIRRLESGEIEQTMESLARVDARCCLGVLMDMAVEAGIAEVVGFEEYEDVEPGFDGVQETSSTSLTAKVFDWAVDSGTNRYEAHGDMYFRVPDVDDDDKWMSLADLNDNGHTFAEIAEVIRENF